MSGEMGSTSSDNGEVLRYLWRGGSLQQAPAPLNNAESVLDDELKMWDAKTMICSVMSICTNEGDPVTDPFMYGALLNKLPNCAMWAACCELNPDGIPHVHTLSCTGQRTDAYKRSALTIWNQLKGTISLDITREDMLDVLKCQKCHRPSSMLAYMTKKPIWVMTNMPRLMATLDGCMQYQKGARFIKEPKTETEAMNSMAKEITCTILEHGCRTVEDCMRRAPEIMQKYLHRGSFQTVVNNCLLYVKATARIWNLNQYKSHNPDPSSIHGILINQGIDVDQFDLDFYRWINKLDTKKNTFVLWGPSNTGKSAMITGLKSCVSWGEIVNSNTFAFEALPECTLGVWEEPLISPELAEKCKQVFEGMETSIPIKYKKPYKLPRIPIIMTTNHAPWRFCTAEETMFRNRMFIYEFRYTMTEPDFIPRSGRGSCQCSYCKRCTGSEASIAHGTTGKMPRGEQSIQAGVLPRDGSSAGDVCTGPMPEHPGSTGRASGSDSGESASTSSGGEKQCTISAGSSSSTGTTTERNIHGSSGKHGSCNTGIGIQSSESRIEQHVESSGNRGHDGENSRADRKRGGEDGGSGDRKRPRIDENQNASSENVGGMLGRGKTIQIETQIQAEERELGGPPITLKIPTVTEWKCYFSYLQNKHG
nr:NS1 [Mute swan feces associated chapparvovirus 2]